MSCEVLIVGGGAAGMMAGIFAGRTGAKTVILERNSRLGLKLGITGKGRCNITNDCSVKDLVEHTPKNGRFLYSAYSFLDSQSTMALFENLRLPLKVERGNRVFPASGLAKDVISALVAELERLRVGVVFESRAKELIMQGSTVQGVVCDGDRSYQASKVVLATGGASYPKTGSSGDGYRLASALGHSVIPPRPALVPLETQEEWVREVQGLSLRNVELKSPYGSEFGEMVFAHYGMSGPIVLTLSGVIVPQLHKGEKVPVTIDLKPALSREQLHARVLRDFSATSRKHFGNSLGELLPSSLIGVIVGLSGIAQDKPVHQVTRSEREHLVELLKNLPLTVTRTRPIDEAIVTSGGIDTREINPKTMESKLIGGLYFAGEVMDVDAYTGGFNLQIAWSTGALAGASASR